MFIRQLCHLASSGGTLQEAFFYQEGFVHFFQRARVFTQSCSNSGQTHRTSLELVYNRAQNLVVYLIQTILVDVQGLQCKTGNLQINSSRTFHLCKVAHTSQQGIGYTGVPRLREAISPAASASHGTSKMRAERKMMRESTESS